MGRYLQLLLIIFLMMACDRNRDIVHDDLDYMPAEGFALLKINNLSAFVSDLKNNHFLNSCKNTTAYKSISRKMGSLQYLQTNSNALLGFFARDNDSVSFLLAAAYSPELFDPGTASNISQETLTYQDISLQKYVIDGKTIFSTRQGRHTLISDSDSLLRVAHSAPGTFRKDMEFKTLFATADGKQNATIFLNLNAAANLLNQLVKPEAIRKLRTFSEWVALDVGSQQDYFGLNGIVLPPDSAKNFISLFYDLRPLPLQSPGFAPQNADVVTAYAINDYQRFAANRRRYDGDSLVREPHFDAVVEVGTITDTHGKSIVLNTLGSESISNYLSGQRTGTLNYREREIHTLGASEILSGYFSPLIGDFQANYYTVIENAVVFSDNEASLNGLIDHYSLEQSFSTSPEYTSSLEYLADEANYLLVTGGQNAVELISESLQESFVEELRKINLSSYGISAQLVAEGNFFHTSLMLKRLDAASKSKGVHPVFTVQLDAPVASEPQFVINHRTSKKEIVVQDEDNKLYLISTDGKVLWKKPLDGPIQGAITQVDLYKNRRLQLAFTTDKQFLVLDRNGREVAPFNMEYPGGILNQLAVFDYDNNRNYRFVVTQADKVYMYDNRGKAVNGFTYKKAEAPIVGPPSHIRFGNRDYLIFQLEDGTLKILNRVGKTRVRVDQKIDFSGNGVFAYNNQFALTDKDGNLFLIDEQGNLKKSPQELNTDHGMEATSKSMAFMNDNVLNVKGRERIMDYGVYTAPRIFYLYDIIYVSVTDIQSRKTFLFNSSAEPIPGFPVSGSSTADLADMDNDRVLEMVVRSKEDAVTLYRINN